MSRQLEGLVGYHVAVIAAVGRLKYYENLSTRASLVL